MFQIIKRIKLLIHQMISKNVVVDSQQDNFLEIAKPDFPPPKSILNVSLLLNQRLYQTNIKTPPAKIIAVFFAFDFMDQSAITDSSIRTFCGVPDKFHIFVKFPNSYRARSLMRECARVLNVEIDAISVFDVDSYDEMDSFFNYKANIFVLGDSWYNVVTFDQAIDMFKHRERNYLYFHDGVYLSLIHSWLVMHKCSWRELIGHFYPTYDINQSLNAVDLLNAQVHMTRPVIKLTGCNNIFVNAENCIPIIESEVGINTVNVIKSFLPIPDCRAVVPTRNVNQNTFLIAHFGIPNGMKQLDKLIKAVEILRASEAIKDEVKLLLAGYGTTSYVALLPPEQQAFIMTEDSPSSEKIVSLMKGADIVVQLRWPIMGQASGVVNEMMGLGLKCITTKTFINSWLQDYVVEAAHDITPEELAKIILQNRGKMVIPPDKHDEILKKFSYQALTDHIYNAIRDTSETRKLEVVGE